MTTITREDIEADLGVITAETWEDRHKVHKYWGRKPSNVVASCIKYFTAAGEKVLDPFSGSYVTTIEGAGLSRQSIGYDFNPFAVRLGRALCSPPDHQRFARAALAVVRAVDPIAAAAYSTPCRGCGRTAVARSLGYDGDTLVAVRYRCPYCSRSEEAKPLQSDIDLCGNPPQAPSNTPDAPMFFGWEMQKLKRRGVTKWSDLFTPRNFAIAGYLWQEIHQVRERDLREWLLITFTSSLAQFTRMIADFSGDAGGPSWKINCYWLPPRWQELNPVKYFENRVRRSSKAILDLFAIGAPFNSAVVERRDSRKLDLLDGSVDYIFTDPPYGGEGVQYGELSMLWCLWLGEHLDLEREIAFNPYRSLGAKQYEDGLRLTFSELYRVLRPGRWMSVTFANKDPQVWDALMASCKDAGFRLVTAAPMKRSAPSLTETNMKRAPKADLLLSFQKPKVWSGAALSKTDDSYDFKIRVHEIARKLIAKSSRPSAQDVFDRITIDWFSWFYENGERPAAVCPTLKAVELALAELGIQST